MNDLLNTLAREQLKADLPEIRPGDTVRARLRAAGVRLRPPRSGLRGPTVAEVAKMRGAGLTVRELARHFSVSHVTILDRLKKAKR